MSNFTQYNSLPPETILENLTLSELGGLFVIYSLNHLNEDDVKKFENSDMGGEFMDILDDFITHGVIALDSVGNNAKIDLTKL